MLEVSQIGKSFFGVPVLRDVSFTLGRGRVLGVVGENGAGKSTLMNILGGVLAPDTGVMKLRGGTPYAPQNPSDALARGVALIHQELNLFPNLSIAENLFLNSFPKRWAGLPLINRREIKARAAKLLESVRVAASPDTLVENLSPGEKQLVEVARALNGDADVIIFDEPTTSLTFRETERLFEIMDELRGAGRSLLYISHALQDVRRLCDEILILRDGAMVAAGTKDEFPAERMISLMVGRPLNQLYPPRNGAPREEKLLEVKNLSQPGIVADIDFSLHAGEILGIFGLMGSGRSELARILFGLDELASGEIITGGEAAKKITDPRAAIKRGMAFLTENRREEGLLMEASIEDNIALASLPSFAKRFGLLDRVRKNAAVAEAAAGVHVAGVDPARQTARQLSGGNQQKVVLAKWLLLGPRILLLDEPTRGIDVGAKYEIYRTINKLADDEAGLLVISSEVDELIGICDRILVMKGGELKNSFRRPEFDREAILRAALDEIG